MDRDRHARRSPLGASRVEIDRTPTTLELRLEKGQSGDVRAYGILLAEKGDDDVCGRFFVKHSTLNVGIVLYRGETSVKPFVSAGWWRERPPTTSCSPEIMSREPDILVDNQKARAHRRWSPHYALRAVD